MIDHLRQAASASSASRPPQSPSAPEDRPFSLDETADYDHDEDYDGDLNVAAAGDYTLYLNSDDGSRLYLDGVLVINNTGCMA